MGVLEEQVSISIKTILMATDHSRPAEKAKGYARALARRFGATLELVHVIDVPQMPIDADFRPVAGGAASNITGSHDLERFLYTFVDGGVATKSFSIESENPARTLLETARRRHCDLIVAGTQSKSRMGKLLLGSTAENLIRSAECPVLTVGPKAPPPPEGELVFERILYATDFSGQADKAASYALSLAANGNARLGCCYVDATEAEDQLLRTGRADTLKQTMRNSLPPSAYDLCQPEFYVEYGDVSEAILKLADRIGADLIVLGARKTSFRMKYLDRGLTPSLLAEAKCPVLTVC